MSPKYSFFYETQTKSDPNSRATRPNFLRSDMLEASEEAVEGTTIQYNDSVQWAGLP